MKKLTTIFTALLLTAMGASAQIVSGASFMNASQRFDVTVPYCYDDLGIQTPMDWGLDLAWISDDHVRCGIQYAGEVVEIIRLSYQATANVEDGEFSSDQITDLNQRASIVLNRCDPDKIIYYLEDDNPTTDSWYTSTSYSSEERARHWVKVIDMTVDYYAEKGIKNLAAISIFNEPDYAAQTGSNTMSDYANIVKIFRTDDAYKDKYADVRLIGGSTLNPDYGLEWWNAGHPYDDEGNTHQLAGTFDSYANFFETVRDYGHHASNDELHSVMEVLVGAEYGIQTGIWWGTSEYARSQIMKATYHRNPGDRLGYGEHRSNWTAAAVYRHADGTVQGFGGGSERQAVTTYFDYFSTDRPVWYDGMRGRDFCLKVPGGSGYMTDDQPYAELCFNIQSGKDIMPYINGTYKIVNVNSGLLLGFNGSPASGWTSAVQRNNSNTYKYLQWIVTPIHSTGDFSYYNFVVNNGNSMHLDVLDWNYNAGANVGAYPGGGTSTEQWYLEYAGDGAFYIRSRISAMCLEVADGSTRQNANIQVGEFTGEPNQQWRFIETGVTPDFEAPSAPSNLKAVMQPASIRLTWDASESTDVMQYAIVRNGSVLAKVEGCEYTDNEAEPDSSYTYYVYAIDHCYNYSSKSNEETNCSITDEKGIIMQLTFNNTLFDETENGNHCALYGDTTYVSDSGHEAISLSGTDNWLQLPYTIASHDEMTIACWFRYSGGNSWQRIFDFGNGTDQNMFLTTNYGSGPRFAIKNGGDEERVDAGTNLVNTRWYHFVVTIGEGKACLYINGELKGTNEKLTIKPSDFRPVLNYIGCSQYIADPCLKGYLADFTVYNYALSEEEVEGLYTGISDIRLDEASTEQKGQEYNLSGRRATSHDKGIIIRDGKKVLVK